MNSRVGSHSWGRTRKAKLILPSAAPSLEQLCRGRRLCREHRLISTSSTHQDARLSCIRRPRTRSLFQSHLGSSSSRKRRRVSGRPSLAFLQRYGFGSSNPTTPRPSETAFECCREISKYPL